MFQGRGRFPVQHPLTENVSVYISKETKANLMRSALEKKITLAELLRRAIAVHQEEESGVAA